MEMAYNKIRSRWASYFIFFRPPLYERYFLY